MSYATDKGIRLVSGLEMEGQSLVDLRGHVASEEERNKIVSDGHGAVGLITFVDALKNAQIYDGESWETILTDLNTKITTVQSSNAYKIADIVINGKTYSLYAPDHVDPRSNKLTSEDMNSIIAPGFYYADTSNTVKNVPGTDIDAKLAAGYPFGCIVFKVGENHIAQLLLAHGLSMLVIRQATGATSDAGVAYTWGAWEPVQAKDFKGATAEAAGANGLVPAPKAGQQGLFLKGDGTWAAIPIQFTEFKGAAAGTTGVHGLVPAPKAGEQGLFLKGDGTWSSIPVQATDFRGASATAAGTNGLVPAPKMGQQGLFLKADGTWAAVPNPAVFKGAGTAADGSTGLVPAPKTGQQGYFLRGDGTWVAIPNASETAAGLMVASDKKAVNKFIANGVTYDPSYGWEVDELTLPQPT